MRIVIGHRKHMHMLAEHTQYINKYTRLPMQKYNIFPRCTLTK